MQNPTNNYEFVTGKQIKQIFSESPLYLDGSNNSEHFEESSIRRIDEPLFLLLNNGVLTRLYATSFRVTDDFERKYVFGKDFNADLNTQQAFQFLCGATILEVHEYEHYYDYENKHENIDEFGEPVKEHELSDITIILDNGIRLVCSMFFDYFDIRIIE